MIENVSAFAAVLRGRGKANSLHDIRRAADMLEALEAANERLANLGRAVERERDEYFNAKEAAEAERETWKRLHRDSNDALSAANAKLAALVEVFAPFAAIYAEARRDFHDGSRRPELDLSKEAWGFNNATVKWADFHRAYEALSALPPPVPAEEGGEMKPCPFCGSVAKLTSWRDGFHIVDCTNNEGNEPGNCPSKPNVEGRTVAEAITAWNTRPTQAPQDVAGLVEGDDGDRRGLFVASYGHSEEAVADALRASPISHDIAAEPHRCACGAVGFKPSVLPGQCEFCGGTVGGQGPATTKEGPAS